MCRSSEHIHSTARERDGEYKDANSSWTSNEEEREKDNFSFSTKGEKELSTTTNGKHLQFKNVKDISSKDSVSTSETRRNTVYHVYVQDVNFALATFPEFFPQGLVIDKDMPALKPDGQKFKSKGLNAGKENLQSECGGLVLWYIREYGL